jgi:ribonuclease/clavin/mitogillin
VNPIEFVIDGVERLALRTPTLPPATETNSYLVSGDREFVVVEPATPYPDEQRTLLSTIAARIADGWALRGVLMTHHHGDHVGAALAVRAAFDAPLMAHRGTEARLRDRVPVDALLEEGDTLLDGRIEVLHTPGHAPGHLCLRDRNRRWLIAGDMVASVGTILIDPEDDGDMREYLAQIARLAEGAPGIVLPAHGAPIAEGEARLRHYLSHRLAREAKVLAAVDAGEGSTEDSLLERAYEDAPRALWPIARRSLRAHLFKLREESRVRLDGGRWRHA